MLDAKRQIAERDSEEIWRHEPPRQGASNEELDEAEAILGVRLDSEYRSFLSRCNGWSALFQENDLFGTDELCGERLREARELVSFLEPEIVDQLGGITPESVLPIAMSATSIDVFVSPIINGRQDSTIIWLAGAEVERFATYSEYFALMLRYNEEEARDLLADES